MLVPPAARDQDGVFTRAQAREAGLSWWVIGRRLAEGSWTTVVTDVYVLAGLPVTASMRARAAAFATGGVVSHESAAVVHGLGLAEPDRPHVTTQRRIHAHVKGVIEHRLHLAEHEHLVVRGIPVTTLRRTVVDLLASSRPQDARGLLFRAVQQRWIDANALHEEIAARRRRHGTPQLRALGALLGTGAHSVAEHALHQILTAIEGVGWTANTSIRLPGGAAFVVDVLLDDVPLVIEVDGRSFHGGDRFQHDRTRQNALVDAGYTVLRFTWHDIVDRPDDVRRVVTRQVDRLAAPRSRNRS